METSSHPVSPLRQQRMLEDMHMRKLAPKTQQPYIRAVSRFAKYLGRSPDTATAEDLRRYQLHLVDAGTSRSTWPYSMTCAMRTSRLSRQSLARSASYLKAFRDGLNNSQPDGVAVR